MNRLLGLAAVLEGVTGVALIIHPALVAQLLFGDGVTGTGVVLARVVGIALLALGVACWPGRQARSGDVPALRAMFTYSLLVTILLIYVGGAAHLAGILLWPAVGAHVMLILLLVVAWHKDRQRPKGSMPRYLRQQRRASQTSEQFRQPAGPLP
jgi:hypothetical protein